MKKSSLSERDIDRLLSGGEPVDGSEDRLTAFVCSTRRVLSQPPDEATEAAHLAAMLAATRPRPSAIILPSSTSAARRMFIVRLRAAAAKVAIGALSLTTTTAGLAMAGVDLPGTVAEKAFQAVGITLPNQSENRDGWATASETSRRVQEAHRRRVDSMSGCEFGASVSNAARGLPEESAPEHCNPPGHNKAKKSDRAGSGPKKQPPGQTKDHPGKDSNPGTGGSSPGRDDSHGKPDAPGGQTEKEEKKEKEKLVAPPDPETNPGNGGTPPGETKMQENSKAAQHEDHAKSKEDES